MNQYRLGRPLGYGGKTVVFEAWQILPDESEEPVAIKRLLPEYRGDEIQTEDGHRVVSVAGVVLSHYTTLVIVWLKRMRWSAS